MLEWNDLAVILAVCRAGSLSGAARALGTNHSTVFRRINAIEERTGVRFFERLPQGYRMTEAGETTLAYAERIEGEVHALGREILGQDMRLQGKVRMTAPEGVTMTMVPGWVADYRRVHPGVSVEIMGSTMAFDLSRREADIAIRATKKPPDASLGRRIGDFRFAVYAAPDYLDSRSDLPLAEHDWTTIDGTIDWLVPLVWRRSEQGEARTVFTSTATLAVQNAAAAGMGLTLLPCYVGDSDERLARVGEPLEPLTIELWILTHPDLRHTARVKTLMSFLYDALMERRELFAGQRPRPPG